MILKAGMPAYGGYTLGRIPIEDECRTNNSQATHQKTGLADIRSRTKVLFVKGAIPGETIEVAITGEKKDFYQASVTNIVEASLDRIMPGCPYFGVCGGCHLQFISYDRQVTLKEEVLSDCLQRIGGIIIDLSSPITSKNNAWNYRHRGQLKVAGEKTGFNKEKSNEVVDIDHCPLMVDGINEAISRVREVLDAKPAWLNNITELHISYGGGVFALAKATQSTGKSKTPPDEIISLLEPIFNGLVIDIRGDKTYSHGKEYLSLDLGDISYSISPTGFFQSNWKLNKVIVDFIINNLHPFSGKKVLDLFAGAGNFSLPIALGAREVIAIEENPYSVKDGNRNAQINGLNNLRFLQIPSENFNIGKYSPDIILLDPPRAGISDKLINNLIRSSTETIVYVSCNPSTLARDIKKLAGKYEIESIRLVDFFPQTYHIETLAFLKRA